MTKGDLINEVRAATGLTVKDATNAVNETLGKIVAALKTGERVQLIGFGTFEVRERQARTGHNPTTGEAIEIPAAKVPAFKAGKALKEAVNG